MFIFLHAKPETEKKIIPILLVHGWPGSIAEFTDIIPILTKVIVFSTRHLNIYVVLL